MKWLRFLLLLGVVAVFGCSGPASTEGQGDDASAADADAAEVDDAAEAEAAQTGPEE
jgi:hypothetical protein